MSSSWLNNCRLNVFSQNGEDGVILAIFKIIGAKNRWCCDVGAHDGFTFSNVANWIQGGWFGVLIEADRDRFDLLRKNMERFLPQVKPFNLCVRDDQLDEILYGTQFGEWCIPGDFDLLNIDVDGSDLQIWRNLEFFSPRVVVIEVDSEYAPGSGSIAGKRTIDETVEIGKGKGYELVLHTGNAIFVRRELAGKLGVEPDRWQELFDRRWVLEQEVHG